MDWCLIYCYMFGHQGVCNEHAEMVPNVVKIREGWELYIVTDVLMVGLSRPLRRL
jgi:hypothetical protein